MFEARGGDEAAGGAVRRSVAPAGLAVLACCLAVACGSDGAASVGAGRFLKVEVLAIESLAAAGHVEDGISYEVRPADPEAVLMGVRLKLVNPNALYMSLLVDEQAVFLEDESGARFTPLDPWERRRVAEEPLPDEATLMPLLWGPLDMPKTYEVEGWMLFETPAGQAAESLTWRQADFVKLLLSRLESAGRLAA